MKASEFSCPKCGAGFSPDSVDPNYDLDGGLMPLTANAVIGLCVTGHQFFAGVTSTQPKRKIVTRLVDDSEK